MKFIPSIKPLLLCLLIASLSAALAAQTNYLGFDRNLYPGDAAMKELRHTFAYTGYWLGNPPGERVNSWKGKRTMLAKEGWGFLLLFNGRDYAQLKGRPNPGARDGQAAVRSSAAEGFRRGSILFLDQEQGGRMLPEQKKYVIAWAEAVRRGGYRPGIYCSGIEVKEPDGTTITTARDLHDSLGDKLVFWIANDACPPAPGCAYPKQLPAPEVSGAPFAEVWQFAQSPRRKEFTASCATTYNKDGNCYVPGVNPKLGLHLDLNVSRVPDPSQTR
ncbi:MAG: DUF1906 domain-containing protein [Acidobacteriota bacterium]|nr:DUF1906 domain-containing protein [Acidobacteriota bacterium]